MKQLIAAFFALALLASSTLILAADITQQGFSANDGFDLTTIELDIGEKIPENIQKFDGIFCMGGPMDTWPCQPW